MVAVSNRVVDLIEGSIGRRTAEAVGRSFFEALQPFGVTAIYARGYLSAQDEAHERVFCRVAPASFMPVYDDDRFYRFNPLPSEARRRIAPVRWSEASWEGRGPTWVRETMRDCGCPDGLIVPCHGPNDYLGVVSLAFDRLDDVAPADRAAIELAGHVLHGRMHGLTKPVASPRLPALTARERDCLLFVAEGRSDAEIAAALGIARTTVATHLVHAREKLGARTRAQAVAAMLSAAYPDS